MLIIKYYCAKRNEINNREGNFKNKNTIKILEGKKNIFI